MQPTQAPQSTGISANWGNPDVVQKFRSEALSKGLGVQTVDSYIQQMQSAYQAQSGHTVQGAIGQAQGAITSGQAQQDPTAALKFLNGGGQLIPAGPDAQASVIYKAGQYFKAHADKKTGYINPQTYNDYLGKFEQSGGNSEDFNKKFQDSYVNPNNIMYNTPDSKTARAALPLVKNVIDSYHNLHMTGSNVENLKGLEGLPILGPIIKQKVLAEQDAHDQFLTAQAGNIRDLAGAGSGQGFRFNLTELNNITNLLPKAEDGKVMAAAKLQKLDTFLQSNMGVSLKQIYGK